MHQLLEKQLQEIISNGEIIIIPGLGGHSGASWAPVLNSNSDISFVLVFNAFDDGGDSGKVTAALGTPAMGDLRNTLVHIWESSQNDNLKELSKAFKKRVNNFDELKVQAKNALEIIYKIAGKREFDSLDIDKYIDAFEQEYFKLDKDYLYDAEGKFVEHNVGNIVLSALFSNLGGINEVISKLKEYKIIAKNIYCVSMSDNESVELVGIDKAGKLVRREKNVDSNDLEIGLTSLNCVSPKSEPLESYETKNEFISEVIKRARAIMWPASSPNNWAVITRIYKAEIALALQREENPAIGICWTPITKERNTYGVADIILFLWQMFGNRIKFIIPQAPFEIIMRHFREYQIIRDAYVSEGKSFQFYDQNIFDNIADLQPIFYKEMVIQSAEYETMFENLLDASGCVNVRYLYPEGEIEVPLTTELSGIHARLAGIHRGIKHNPKFMSEFIKLLIENNWEISRELLLAVETKVTSDFKFIKNGETNGMSEKISESEHSIKQTIQSHRVL